MRDQQWENMSDTDFEALLESSVSQLPPDDIVAGVTPWKKSVKRVLIGMALTAVTLNFLCLNYILPTVGTILSLLGFRTLQSENKWFKSCFAVSVIRAVYLFASLIINTTIIQSTVNSSAVASALTIINLLLMLTQFVCLWRGFISVQKKAGIPPHAKGAVMLIVWYALICLLALIQYSGPIIIAGMLIGYCFIIRSLYKLSKELDEAGYVIRTVPIKITDKFIVISLASFLMIGFVCGYVFGGSYPIDWVALDPGEHNEAKNIKDHLADLGFPRYVLDDLSAQDIMACEGALKVVVDVTDEPVNNGRVEMETYQSGNEEHISRKTVYDVKELRITGVGVQIPGDPERWIIIHHFLWTTDPGFYGTESIQLWPAYDGVPEGWRSLGDVTGRILYDDDEGTFAADYYSLGLQSYVSNDFPFAGRANNDVFAAFSMPRGGYNHRGYLAYCVEAAEPGYLLSSWFNYTHQRSPFQYPVMTAMEKRMSTGWNSAGAFRTVQDALQFYPADAGNELIS